MTRTIYLQGKMGELFGDVWNLNAATVADVCTALTAKEKKAETILTRLY